MIRSQLRAQVRRDSIAQFDRAIATVREEWKTAPRRPRGGQESLPFDTGKLRGNLRSTNRSTSSDILAITFSVQALNDGFDYAAFLERASRVKISAKRAKSLRWFSAGQPVFAKEVNYVNEWQGWWNRWWGGSQPGGGRWNRALREA